MKRFLIPVAVFAALAAVLAMALQRVDTRGEVPSPLVGKPAPELGGPRLFEPEGRLRLADVRGEVALVNVWASWCAACRDEHAYISALSDRGIPVYGINYKDERADALGWLERFGNPYTASVHDLSGDIGMEWGVYGVPETFILDADGRIDYKHIGAISQQDLNEEILPRIRRLRDGGEA
ncbi:DsbE family thiol:disulfide interchange protein [Arhodomonas sp. SL1]|uniref:DsbE family thiol:disulfide interchange protein n=1 Tax=Arhodomonas sp. SL1 TaxID=3425691 RepID=UPI003F8850E0